MSKEWPADGSMARLDDLLVPLREAFLRLHPGFDPSAFDRHGTHWEGLPLAVAECAWGAPAGQLGEALLQRRVECGEGALDAVLGLAVALGMEQGRRQFVKGFRPWAHDAVRALRATGDERAADVIESELVRRGVKDRA